MADPRYSGYPSPMFQPANRDILTISVGYPALITTTFDGSTPGNHQYLTGLIVRIYVFYGWGMQQINHLEGPITVINDTQFTIPINTSNFDPLVVPSANPYGLYTPPQVVPIGEVNDLLLQSTQNVLPYPLHLID